MKNLRKTLALLLAFAMCVSMLGTTAFAARMDLAEEQMEIPMGEEVQEGSQKEEEAAPAAPAAPAEIEAPEEIEISEEIDEAPAAAELLAETQTMAGQGTESDPYIVAQLTDLQALTELLASGSTTTLYVKAGGNIALPNGVHIEIPESATVVLDLAGYSLTAGINAIINKGTLTINDSSEGEVGKVYTTNIEAQGRHAVLNYGTIVINGGTFGSSASRGSGFRNRGGTATINGGKFTACDNYTNGGYAYALGNDSGETTINNATVYGNCNGLLAADGGTLTVKDGTFTLGDGSEKNLFRVFYTTSGAINVEGGTFTKNTTTDYGFMNGTINISGGTFEDKQKDIYADGGKVTISGGEFKTKIAEKTNAEVLAVDGGKFTNDVSAYVAPSAVQDENGTVRTRVEGDEGNVAHVGENYYATLQAAIDAAEDGQTVEVIADAGNGSVANGKKITVNIHEGVTVTDAENYGLGVFSGAELTVTGTGTIVGGKFGGIYCTGENTTVVVSEGFTGTVKGAKGIYCIKEAVANVYAGTITTTANRGTVIYTKDGAGTANVFGGTFTYGDGTAYVLKGKTGVAVKVSYYQDETGKVIELTEANSEVKMGDTYCRTLLDAIADAPANENVRITLLGDVDLRDHKTQDDDLEEVLAPYVEIYDNCNITLDLNGQTLYGALLNHGVLTVTGNGTVDATDAVDPNGTTYHWPAVQNRKGAEAETDLLPQVTIENGTFKSGKSGICCIYDQAGTVEIKGGGFTATGNQAAVVKDSNSGYDTEVKISGGSFNSNVSAFVVEGAQASEVEDGKWTIGPATGEDYVAQVGNVSYKTLQEAITACPKNDTVKVIADVALTGAINPGKSITIEGVTKENGSKPVISGGSGLFSVTKASATLKNLELKATGNTYYIYQEADLTVDGCDFTMAEGVNDVGNLVMDDGHAKLTFTNNKVLAHSRVALAGPGNDSVITNNVFDLVDEHYDTSRTSVIGLVATEASGPIVITGNVFKNANRALGVDNSYANVAEMLTFKSNAFIECRWAFELDPTKQGGFDLAENYYSFNGTVGEAKVENAKASGSHTDGSTAYVPAEGETPKAVVSSYYKQYDETNGLSELTTGSGAVAQVGETVYTSLQAAIDATQSGAVKLLQNTTESITVAAGKNITLDLNGKTLTNDPAKYSWTEIENIGRRYQDTIWVQKGATLTVNGEGTVRNTAEQAQAIFNEGTTTLNGGTYERTANKGYVIVNHGAKMTIGTGVTATTTDNGSALVVNGYQNTKKASEAAKNTRVCYDDTGASRNVENPVMEITGGSFTGGKHTVSNDNYGKMTVSGNPTVTVGTGSVNAFRNEATSTAEIKGGSFTGNVKEDNAANKGLQISGGSFTVDVNAYCTADMMAVKNEDGKYVIEALGESNAAATIEGADSYYKTLAEALAAATEGQTVKLLKDAELTGQTTLRGVNLDLGGKTITDKSTGYWGLVTAGTVTVKNGKIIVENTQGQGIYVVNGSATAEKLTVEAEGTGIWVNGNAIFTLDKDSTVSAATYGIVAYGGTEANAGKDPTLRVYGKINATGANGAAIIGSGNCKTAPGSLINIYPGAEVKSNGLAIYHPQAGKLNILGGLVEGHAAGIAIKSGTLNVKSGATVSCVGAYAAPTEPNSNGAAASGAAIQIEANSGYAGGIEVNVEDGATVKSANGNAIYQYYGWKTDETVDQAKAKLTKITITGGIVTGGNGVKAVDVYDAENADGKIAISGGTFSTDVSAYCVEGYQATRNADGTYGVAQTTGGNTSGGTTTGGNENLDEPDVPLDEKPFLFTDVVENDWFYDAVKYAFNNDLMLGTTDTTFEPTMTASRGMIVTMLYRLEKEPTAATKADFPDVEDGAWYTNAVHWGNEAGVVTGYSDGRYAPDDMITREQLVVILYRYAKLKGCDVSARADLSKYADVDQVSGYAADAMAWAVEIGLVKGTSDTTLSPAGVATRGQIATIMTRLCEDVLPKEA